MYPQENLLVAEYPQTQERSGCIAFSRPEDLQRYLEGYTDFVHGFDFRGDTIDPQAVIRKIRIKTQDIMREKGMKKMNPLLGEMHARATLHAFCTEKIFMPTKDISSNAEQDAAVNPICVVYDADGSIRILNQAYIEATGIRDLGYARIEELVGEEMAMRGDYGAMIKQMSRETVDHPKLGKVSKWYDLIYADADLERVIADVGSLASSDGYGDVFTMKLTGVSYRWNSFKIAGISGNIRSALPIGSTGTKEKTGMSMDIAQGNRSFYPLGAVRNITAYRKAVLDILLAGSEEDEELKGLWKDAMEYSLLGQTLFDRSGYAMRLFDGKENVFNMPYGNATDYEPQRLKEILDNGRLISEIYGDNPHERGGHHINDVIQHFRSLLRQKSYTYIFSPKKNGRRLNMEYTTYRYDGERELPDDITDFVAANGDSTFIYRKDSSNGSKAGDPYPLMNLTIGQPLILDQPLSSIGSLSPICAG